MKSAKEEPTAVFRDRDTMEDAVRALVAKGIRPERIRISRGITRNGTAVEAAPERGGVMVTGLLIGAVVGATLALGWMFWLSGLVPIPPAFIVLRTLGGAASGALVGALLAILFYAGQRRLRDARLARGAKTEGRSGRSSDDLEYVVRVKPEDEDAVKDVRDFLVDRGGHLVPTPS